jgi:hypothetical protein
MTNKTKPLKTLILERSHSWMSSFNTLKREIVLRSDGSVQTRTRKAVNA